MEMRIAFITEPGNVVYPDDNGGGSSISMLTYQMARRLINAKNEVIIFSKQADQLPLEESDKQGIFHYRIDFGAEDKLMRLTHILDRLQFHLWKRMKRPLWASSLYYSGYIKQVGDYLAHWNPDVVHIHNYSQYIPIIRRKVPKARIVIHMHIEWLSQLDVRMIRRRLQHVDLILGCSKHITEGIQHRFPEYANRCQTLYNGTDLSQFSPPNDASFQKKNGWVLLFAGRVTPEKGVHVLLDAYKIVLEKFPDIYLKIVGRIGSNLPQIHVAVSDDKQVQDLAQFYKFPPSRDFYYQQLLASLSETERQNVSFLGPMPYNQMQNVYRSADMFVSASLSESFGLPILEAMASGLPVVASEVGGIPEIVVEGETGFLFKPGDSAGLAEAIIYLIEHEKFRQKLRTRAIQEIEGKFSWETITNELLHQYQTLSLRSPSL